MDRCCDITPEGSAKCLPEPAADCNAPDYLPIGVKLFIILYVGLCLFLFGGVTYALLTNKLKIEKAKERADVGEISATQTASTAVTVSTVATRNT